MTEGAGCDGAATDCDETEVAGFWIICSFKSAIYWCFQCSKCCICDSEQVFQLQIVKVNCMFDRLVVSTSVPGTIVKIF